MIGKIIGLGLLVILLISGSILVIFLNKIPDISLFGKNPEQLKDFIKDLPFLWNDPIIKEKIANNPQATTSANPQVLGRPKKIVEFYCISDEQCKSYFNRDNAFCQTSTGICYII